MGVEERTGLLLAVGRTEVAAQRRVRQSWRVRVPAQVAAEERGQEPSLRPGPVPVPVAAAEEQERKLSLALSPVPVVAEEQGRRSPLVLPLVRRKRVRRTKVPKSVRRTVVPKSREWRLQGHSRRMQEQ